MLTAERLVERLSSDHYTGPQTVYFRNVREPPNPGRLTMDFLDNASSATQTPEEVIVDDV
jgi:hypothetical protein